MDERLSLACQAIADARWWVSLKVAPNGDWGHVGEMEERRPKRPRDPNQLAKRIVEAATGEVPDADPKKFAGRCAGGKKGAASRAANLTPEERAEIARAAASARWKKSD